MRKNYIHIILYPISLIYGLVTAFRNWLFDIELLKSTGFSIPTITVGNLSVGGAGKTPHTEFILSSLQEEYKMAVLSRGYKRNTKGFRLANEKSDNRTIGDESFQIFQKFPAVTVAVDEKRVHGVQKLLELIPDLQVIVLDDAFQHRRIRSGFSILVTDFSNLYCNDRMLPVGRLREWKSSSKRANCIIVSKCPTDLKPIDMRLVETELKPETNQSLFFSSYEYDELIPLFPQAKPENWTYDRLKGDNAGVLLVAGIVSPQPIVDYLKKFTDNTESLFFPDHHAFNPKDFNLISKKFNSLTALEKILLVTEKDAARLLLNPLFPESLKPLTFALPIKVKILNNQDDSFIQKIKNYVAENSRNR
ncbi:MAG: tetraacyldisaccharide 4'-kinase [Paludibacter sp.]